MKLIKNTKIITPFIEIPDGFLVVKDKIIHFIGDVRKDKKEYKYFVNKADGVIDFKEKIAIPGFIEIHTHSALGKDYSSSPDLLLEDSKFRATKGVVGFLPTIGAMVPADRILDSASKLIEIIENGVLGAKPLGINLEDPYINPNLGAQSFILQVGWKDFLVKKEDIREVS